MRLLTIEDDAEQARFLLKGLREAGHRVDHAANGRDGLFLAVSEPYDLIIVDRMLPQMDGLAVITALRAAGQRTPVLILSALGQVDDRIRGLKAGGDDYVVKPFVFAELLARIDAITRRSGDVAESTTLRLADLEMDRLARSVRRDGRLLDLKPQEYRLLEYLLLHAGQVVTRTMLLEGVWDYHFDPQTNVIDVHISRLRAKIDPAGNRPLIHTVRGAGYCMREQE
ncbi:response regulator transcription factor [Flagellatimonas centrodinii]|uniref:winged helix-turn-helix domain-containing protein n=1 Tax=Flagellatimonas centrodinii TaxID=2806210 RepID=UPI001FFCE54F|nr:response regulator transcription factor [Flagellatimonas centrodinii]ULQ46402.1 response regulator transcription factor [Flagellatimonas centrodinii]